MVLAIRGGKEYRQLAASIHETMRRTMEAAWDTSQEPDPIHAAYTEGYEKGFADAVGVLNLALGLANSSDEAGEGSPELPLVVPVTAEYGENAGGA